VPVKTTHNRHEYDCDGVQTVFPFTYPITKEEDINVIHRTSAGQENTLTLTTNYTVSKAGAKWDSGGNVTTVQTYPSGDKIILLRELDTTQSLDLIYNDNLPSDQLEIAIDKRAMIEQQLIEKLQRTLLLLKSSSYKDLTLPDPEADKYLAWKSTLDGLKNVTVQSAGDLTVSSFIETLLDDADAAAARATLFNSFMQTLLDDADAAEVRATINTLQNIFTTKGDLIIQGESAEERLAGGLLNTVLKGQGAGEKPIFEKPTLLDTGIEIGESTRDGSGVQIISGLAFRPSVVFFIANDETQTNMNFSIGFDDGTTHKCIYQGTNHTMSGLAGTWSIYIMRAGTDHIEGFISSMKADGFEITWNETGSCAADFAYLALP